MTFSINFGRYIREFDIHPRFTQEEVNSLSSFVELCSMIYQDNWIQAVASRASVQNDKLYVTPERVDEYGFTIYDFCVFDIASKLKVQGPKFIPSSPCSSIFCIIAGGTGCSTVIHSHSPGANWITNLVKTNSFEFIYRNYLKDLILPNPNLLSATNLLRIPIVENNRTGRNLLADVDRIVKDTTAPTPCILVRSSGVFVWGNTWEEAQMKNRALDVLFNAAVELIRENKPLVPEGYQEMEPAAVDESEPTSLPSAPVVQDIDYYTAQVDSLTLSDPEDDEMNN